MLISMRYGWMRSRGRRTPQRPLMIRRWSCAHLRSSIVISPALRKRDSDGGLQLPRLSRHEKEKLGGRHIEASKHPSWNRGRPGEGKLEGWVRRWTAMPTTYA